MNSRLSTFNPNHRATRSHQHQHSSSYSSQGRISNSLTADSVRLDLPARLALALALQVALYALQEHRSDQASQPLVQTMRFPANQASLQLMRTTRPFRAARSNSPYLMATRRAGPVPIHTIKTTTTGTMTASKKSVGGWRSFNFINKAQRNAETMDVG